MNDIDEDKAINTKIRFKCKKVNIKASLLTKMHTDAQCSIVLSFAM